MKLLKDIPYVPSGGPSRSLDLYLPEPTSRPVPLVVYIHGGAFKFGDKRDYDAALFTDAGMATASLNYRLSGEAPFPALVEDCKAAIRFLRANAKRYQLDPANFGAWGESAGGYLVAFLGTTGHTRKFDTGAHSRISSRLQAVVDWYGPTDLLTMDAPMEPEEVIPQSKRDKHLGPGTPEAQLLGHPIEADPQKAREASPATYIRKDAPPFLIVHGDRDTIIGLQQSRKLHEGLKKSGATSTLRILKNTGHGDGDFQKPEEKQHVRDFFLETLTRHHPR